jgi:hypothetical protein
MSGDYTRVRFSARPGYIGMLEQQGRVRLDADGNEQVESIDRRRRAESIDTIGNGVVPSTTPHAFEIGKDASGGLTIGPGRAYVDGILVDCWGADSQEFQPDLGELRGKNPLPYEQQPFYYGSSFPQPASSGTSIVYLDVWQREVTALEDPGLIDPAIEGIDTTTRIQAAWQVKALSPTTSATCTDNPPEWLALIAPSAGVLSTATTPAPSSGSPCIIDPVGGYTGLENRLYRVQVQQSGTVGGAGAATFVWSKDNASLGAAVLSVTSVSGTECQLSVSTIGRDKTFRFNVNDTLEVLDDFVEWSIRETGHGGTFVQVTSVDPEQLTINVTPDISSSFVVVPVQHPRIRRWDASPQPTQDGVALPLGTDGITVTFALAAWAFPTATTPLHAGDYWVFYARTATGTIEILNQAPPRGVLHHYWRLALVNPGQDPINCRTFWPPTTQTVGGGCCEVTVGDGGQYATLDAALSDLLKQRKTDICICMLGGDHNLPVLNPDLSTMTKPVRLKIKGCGFGTRIHSSSPPINLSGFASVQLRDLAIDFVPVITTAGVVFDRCDDVRLDSCVVSGLVRSGNTGTVLGIVGASSVNLCSNIFEAYGEGTFSPVGSILAPVAKLVKELVALFKGNPTWSSFASLSLPLAKQLAKVNFNGRNGAATAVGKAVTNAMAKLELSFSELTAYSLLEDALASQSPTAETLNEALNEIRSAAIKARPSTAIVVRSAFPATAEEQAWVLIADNQISGTLSFYGLPGGPLPPDIINRLVALMKSGEKRITGTTGTLRVSGNKLVRVALGNEILAKIPPLITTNSNIPNVFGSCLLTENIIEGAPNELISYHSNLSSNDFPLTAVILADIQAQIKAQKFFEIGTNIANTAIYVGNHARVDSMATKLPAITAQLNDASHRKAQAANLDLTIYPP